MFTGIIEGRGTVLKVDKHKSSRRLHFKSTFSLKGTKPGDSIAVDGCCLTVTKIRGKQFSADISPETLSRTTLGSFKKGTSVNLERPLRLSDRLGGHIVQGHVDGVGRIAGMKYVSARPEPYHLVQIKVPRHLRPYMIDKGSVTVDGISLTVNRVKGDTIELCIIPHTRKKTTLTLKKVGEKVNLEADILLKYLKKLVKS
ncbi:MAG: riboflavin synthase [Candidatus Binatia bacterium]